MRLGNFFYSAKQKEKRGSRIPDRVSLIITKCPIHGLTWTLKTFGYLSMSACVVYKERLTNLGAHERVFVFHKHGVDTREWRGAMGGSRSRPGRGLCVTLGRALRPHRHEPCPVRRHTRGRRRSRGGRCTPGLSVGGNSAGFKWVANGSLQSLRF